jgi:hypothetical protein
MILKQLIRRVARAVLAVMAGLGIQSTTHAAGLLTLDHPNVRAVVAVQNTLTAGLMTLPGVLGTAVGLDDSGETALVIYVDQDSPSRADIVRGLPPQIRGIGVNVELTEKFRAFGGKPPGTPGGGGGGGGGGVSHTAKQAAPIQLGTSGGWRSDLANGYCCGGTLGSLIQVNGIQYILSNYHVFESDTVPGGNGIVATTGDNIIQPGLIDVGCNAANAQNVATLVKLSSLPDSNVDCSVAAVVSGQVRSDGAILEIGTISSTTVSASINQAVKKSGRTTGLSSSTVSGLNATIIVTYENECAGGTAFTKTFTGQIVIANRRSQFLNSGDSGSLMLEDVGVTTPPRAVGLLYAGSSTSAIANPIGQVLTFIGNALGGTATMVGN